MQIFIFQNINLVWTELVFLNINMNKEETNQKIVIFILLNILVKKDCLLINMFIFDSIGF